MIIGGEHAATLLSIGVLLLVSQLGGRLAAWLRTPRVLGYLVSGIVLGTLSRSSLGDNELRQRLDLIPELALSIIAFSIGGALRIANIRRLGKPIAVITVTQAVAAAGLVAVMTALFLYYSAWGGSRAERLAVSIVIGVADGPDH